MTPLKGNEIYGNWASLLLPVEKDDGINYSKLADEIDILIAMEVNGIYSNGTACEFYNQTEDEFDKINELLADKCNASGMPFQIGCSHMSPIISLERLRRVVQLKPGAVQVILPDWFPPVMPEILHYLERLAETAAPIGIVLYNPPHAKKKLKPEDFHQIKEAGISLAGCKVSGGDKNWYAAMKRLNPELSLFVPGHQLATGISLGAHGSYSNVACLHPAAAQWWYASMQTNMESALELEKRIQLFITKYIVPFMVDKGCSDTAVDKFLAATGGWADVGTRLRWPYQWISEEEIPEVRKVCRKLLPEFFRDN